MAAGSMPLKSDTVETVDGYIAALPPAIRARLQKIRSAIRKAVPDAEESIGYRIPAYKLNGPLIYFAAHTAHIGLYPITAGVKAEFAEDLAPYAQSTGTVRFPHDEPLPIRLIAKIAKFRALENAERAAIKKLKKAKKLPSRLT